jgi:hypothetical protein
MDFRRFAEDVIRRETPAHLAPKICWVSDEDMQRIENAWAAWRAALSGAQAAGAGEVRRAARRAVRGEERLPRAHARHLRAPENSSSGRAPSGA